MGSQAEGRFARRRAGTSMARFAPHGLDAPLTAHEAAARIWRRPATVRLVSRNAAAPFRLLQNEAQEQYATGTSRAS